MYFTKIILMILLDIRRIQANLQKDIYIWEQLVFHCIYCTCRCGSSCYFIDLSVLTKYIFMYFIWSLSLLRCHFTFISVVAVYERATLHVVLRSDWPLLQGFAVGNGLSDWGMNSNSIMFFGYYHGLWGQA